MVRASQTAPHAVVVAARRVDQRGWVALVAVQKVLLAPAVALGAPLPP